MVSITGSALVDFRGSGAARPGGVKRKRGKIKIAEEIGIKNFICIFQWIFLGLASEAAEGLFLPLWISSALIPFLLGKDLVASRGIDQAENAACGSMF
jgi:hypothetical protein